MASLRLGSVWNLYDLDVCGGSARQSSVAGM